MFQKLKEENQKLWDKNLSLKKEIEDLKFQVSTSAFKGQKGTYTMQATSYDKSTASGPPLNTAYSLTNANCLQMTMKGFNKGTLKNGTSVGSFMSGQLGKTYLADTRPNTAESVFNQLFYNRRFTRAAAKNDVTWEALYGSPSARYKSKGLYYANTLGVYR